MISGNEQTMNPDHSAGVAHLHKACWLRAILASVQVISLLVACQWFHHALPAYTFFLVISINGLMIGFTIWRLTYLARPIMNAEFFLQLLMDVASLSLFLYFTGGYTNPLVSLLLIPTSIGAALLPERYSWALSAAAITAYSWLMIWYQPLTTAVHHTLNGSDHNQQMISFHLVGMWVTFVVSALLINYFVSRMAATVRHQQKTIAKAREHQLQSENILAIAIQAAGAAHELGTPLATMAVLLSDLQEEYRQNAALGKDIRLLQSQVQICKQRLEQLVHESQHTRTETVSLDEFVRQIEDQWQLLRPAVALNIAQQNIRLPEATRPADILCAPSLYQAVIALLDNAADASPEGIRLSFQREKAHVIIRIDDQGEGIPTAIAEQFGTIIPRPEPSRKSSGLGLGLLLSQASIERLGGQVRVYNRSPRGTRIDIHLPISN